VLALGVQAGLAGKKFPEVLRQLHDKGVLSDQNFDAINGLRALRNLVAHRSEPSVSEAKATEYFAMAGVIRMILEQVTRKVGGGWVKSNDSGAEFYPTGHSRHSVREVLISKLTSQSATKLPSYDFGEISSLAS
jgi:hypothetical protein